MANYSYINLPKKIKPLSAETLESDLKQIVKTQFQNPVDVDVPLWNPEPGASHIWLITATDSSAAWPNAEHEHYGPYGFTVQLAEAGKEIIFRHSPGMFESWFRGKTREALAIQYKASIFFDATDETYHPHRWSAKQKKKYSYDYPRYGDYLTRNFKLPLTEEDETYLMKYKMDCPVGWW